MAKYIKSEVFASDIFKCLWYKSKMLETSVSPSSNTEEDWMPVFFIDSVTYITCFRRKFFQKFLTEIISNNAEIFSQSQIDFYLFFKDNVASVFTHKDMFIFDKIFMSLAFALEMCYWCIAQGKKEQLIAAPLSWLLYFHEEMLQKFLSEGGWNHFVSHADFYQKSKIFSLGDTILSSIEELEYINVKESFETAFEDYDKLELIEYFTELLNGPKHRGLKVCLQCFPIFTAINSLIYPEESFSTVGNILTEGYIKILLKMLSDDDMKTLKITATDNLKVKRPDIFGYVSYQESFSNSDEEDGTYKKNQLERRFIEINECKKIATKSLIEHLFQESYIKCNKSDCCVKSHQKTLNTCIFCAKKIFAIPEHTTEPLCEEINVIKSTILDTIKASGKSTVFNKTQLNTENYPKKDIYFSSEENMGKEKIALRMFTALGVDPGGKFMLNALKNDLKLATENTSKFKLENGDKRKLKKPKNKKQKV